jgi:hypothetical protein
MFGYLFQNAPFIDPNVRGNVKSTPVAAVPVDYRAVPHSLARAIQLLELLKLT